MRVHRAQSQCTLVYTKCFGFYISAQKSSFFFVYKKINKQAIELKQMVCGCSRSFHRKAFDNCEHFFFRQEMNEITIIFGQEIHLAPFSKPQNQDRKSLISFQMRQ